jgi:hypothetical protein
MIPWTPDRGIETRLFSDGELEQRCKPQHDFALVSVIGLKCPDNIKN